MHHLKSVIVLMVLSFLVGLTVLPINRTVGSHLGQESPSFSDVIGELDMNLIRSHVENFSRLGSRVTGYPGCNLSAQYIKDTFVKYNLSEVHYEYYDVVAPIDYGGEVTLLSLENRTIKAYPLWPNHVNPSTTPPEGLVGRLVYGGTGSLKESNGYDLKDAIVLLEFNGRWFWKNAVLLGAKAIVFIAPDRTTRLEAQQKALGIPLSVPRLYVTAEDLKAANLTAEDLKQMAQNGEAVVRVKSSMKWEKRTATNVIGFVKGVEKPDEVMVITAYYDSISIVPSIAPGASESLGVSALLEFARILSKHPPSRSVLFLAVSGHNQGITGSREFVEAHFDELGSKLKLFISIDLSGESNTISVRIGTDIGITYDYARVPNWDQKYIWIRGRIFEEYLGEINEQMGRKYDDYVVDLSRYPLRYEPLPISFDNEPFAIASSGGALTFSTANAMHELFMTPFDTYENIWFENVQPQVEFVLGCVYGFSKEPTLGVVLNPQRFSVFNYGYVSATGRVWEYNITSAWYDPVPNALVRVTSTTSIAQVGAAAQYGAVPGATTIMAGFDTIVIADGTGTFTVKGLQPYTSYQVQASVINSTTGNVLLINDMGGFRGAGQGGVYSNPFIVDRRVMDIRVPVFKCGSIPFLLFYDPRSLSGIAGGFDVRNIQSHMAYYFIGPMIVSAGGQASDAMVFVPPDIPIEIIIRGAGGTTGTLTNADEHHPEGVGYTLRAGESSPFKNTPFITMKDFYLLTNSRLNMLRSFGIGYSATAEFYQNLSTHAYEEALVALEAKQYDVAYDKIYSAWTYQITAYAESFSMIQDTINAGLFFFLLLFPFTYFIERFLFRAEGKKRLLVILIIFTVFMALLFSFHPGLRVASNVIMVAIGLVTATLTIPILIITAIETQTALRDFRRGYLGIHWADVSRASLISAAFSTGIENMKKRKFRTALTFISIIIVMFGLISFTSLSIIRTPQAIPVEGNPIYEGLLLKHVPESWAAGFPESFYFALTSAYGSETIISPRAWLYPPRFSLPVTGPRGTSTINAFLGLHYQEKEITKVNSTIIKGRWFEPGDMLYCIISNTTAEETGVDVGSPISVWGLRLIVVGVFDGRALDSLLDLYPAEASLTPVDVIASQFAYPEVVRLRGSAVIIIPYQLAISAGGTLVQIAMKSLESNPQLVKSLATEIAYKTSFPVYSSTGSGVFQHATITRPVVLGWESMVPVTFVAAFILLNTMLGSVQERMKDIAIYASVGLSPMHITGLFLAESLVYAVVSTVIGYLAGVGVSILLRMFGFLPPGFYANYSSMSVVITAGFAALITIASSLYPALKASRLVTPSVERGWAIPTRPLGDEWTVSLPFRATESELLSIFAFMKEYFEAHSLERVGVFQATELGYEAKEEEGIKVKTLYMQVRLIPWEIVTLQKFRFQAILPPEETAYQFKLHITRIVGYLDTWKAANRVFIDSLRRQLLIWRTLSDDDKKRYIAAGKNLKFG